MTINNLIPFSKRSGRKILAPISITENSSICFPANFDPLSKIDRSGKNFIFLITTPTSRPLSNVSINLISKFSNKKYIIIPKIKQKIKPGKFSLIDIRFIIPS